MLLKIVSVVGTVILLFIAIYELYPSDHFLAILGVYLAVLLVGIFLNSPNQASVIYRSIGWGVIGGLLSSIIIIIGFIVWLSFNFPQ